MKNVLAAALFLMLLGSIGCGPVNRYLKSTHLLSSHQLDYHSPGCPTNSSGTLGQEGEVDKHPGEVVVGFDRAHKTPCQLFGEEQINHVYRGAVRFDVANIPKTAKFTKAQLIFERGEHHAEIGSDAGNEGTCVKHVWTASQDWWSAGFASGTLVPGTPLADLPYTPLGIVNVTFGKTTVKNSKTFSVDVTPALEAWVNQGQPNHGFVLVGGSEIFPEDDDQDCYSWYGPFVLNVTYEPFPE